MCCSNEMRDFTRPFLHRSIRRTWSLWYSSYSCPTSRSWCVLNFMTAYKEADILQIEVMLYGMLDRRRSSETDSHFSDHIGTHIVLFALCCYVLLARQKRVQWFVLGSAFIMFALSTADIAYTIRCSTTDLPDLIYPMDPGKVAHRIRPKPALYVTNK